MHYQFKARKITLSNLSLVENPEALFHNNGERDITKKSTQAG